MQLILHIAVKFVLQYIAMLQYIFELITIVLLETLTIATMPLFEVLHLRAFWNVALGILFINTAFCCGRYPSFGYY